MSEYFYLSQFDSYREDNRREVKQAVEGFPHSLWDTYSSFANCYGGVIILGVKENADGSWQTAGLKNAAKLQKEFWDTINNNKKVSVNLLGEGDVETFEYNGDIVMVISVPPAHREQKPVFINDNVFGGTFRRDWEGDYHCTATQVKSMLRDQAEETIDMAILENLGMEALNEETVYGYRNYFASQREEHPFLRLYDNEFLRSIGAAAYAPGDRALHPTVAGLLMFGNEYDIVRRFPDYFLDYRVEASGAGGRADRLQSGSGDWSGNICDFYFRVMRKLRASLRGPIGRVDDGTPVHEVVREALANCLVNADYYGTRGVVIEHRPDRITFANPGYSRTGKRQMLLGGVSDPRNRGLMKMFSLIGIGERAGSGIPRIVNICRDMGLQGPTIDERFNPDRTVVTISLEKSRH